GATRAQAVRRCIRRPVCGTYSTRVGDAPTARGGKRPGTAVIAGVGAARFGHQALALPGLLWTLAFFLVPLAVMVVYSFGQIDIITFKTRFGWTLSNYRQLNNSIYLQ